MVRGSAPGAWRKIRPGVGADDDLDANAVVARSQTRGPVELSFGELRKQVAACRAGLQRLGVGPGDRVVAYLPNIPQTLVAFLATASLGAIWATCAPEFGVRSVVDRLGQLKPVVLLAVAGYRFGDKEVDRRAQVAEVRERLPSLRAVVHVPYRGDNPAVTDLAAGHIQMQFSEPTPVLLGKEWLKPTAYMMAKFGMTLCALGMAEELREDGIASNTLWPRTLVATAAVQNLLGGEEAMGRARKPEVYSDAAYVILNKSAREYTGNVLLCEDVLVESGVTDLSVYNCVPGGTLGVDFWVDGVNPPGYTGP